MKAQASDDSPQPLLWCGAVFAECSSSSFRKPGGTGRGAAAGSTRLVILGRTCPGGMALTWNPTHAFYSACLALWPRRTFLGESFCDGTAPSFHFLGRGGSHPATLLGLPLPPAPAMTIFLVAPEEQYHFGFRSLGKREKWLRYFWG